MLDGAFRNEVASQIIGMASAKTRPTQPKALEMLGAKCIFGPGTCVMLSQVTCQTKLTLPFHAKDFDGSERLAAVLGADIVRIPSAGQGSGT